MTRGLVIGKFYPPHRGHKFLIDSALRAVDRLHVIVCQREAERPAGELRASWLREIHPTANVLLIDDDGFDPDDSELWARNCRRWLGFIPDLVFTSEDYGERFAGCLGSQHVSIDRARHNVPVSGTEIRKDPLANWDYLEPAVRGYYAKRVCLIGAESTGKTTLAEALATNYQTRWVPEYGREVSERMLEQNGKYDWQSQDFVEIALTQCRMENRAARECNRVLITDTDAFATSIWHRRYLHRRSPEVEAIAKSQRRPDLYLLTDTKTPFVQDGTRDGEAIREWMQGVFLEELVRQQREFEVLSGSYEERFRQAVKHIDIILMMRAP
jgi:NadR type nicotinamide-nucleotide adenylyltransferase